MDATPHYVYLACCAHGTLYVGSTSNVERRIAQHNASSGGRYTRRNRPLQLMAVWTFSSRMAARQAERALKRLPPERKRALATATLSPGQDS